MAYTVYVLYSKKDKELYVGCTNNLDNRLKSHQSGHIGATRHRRPLELIYKEQFNAKTDAFNRERFLKSLWGSREKKKILQRYLNGVS